MIEIPRSRFILVLFLALLPLAAARAQSTLALAPGDRAPGLRANTSQGDLKVLDYGAQRWTLVNFWATWCEPCKTEIPALQQLHERHAARGLGVVGVLSDNVSAQQMQAFLDAYGVKYLSVVPRKGQTKNWGGMGMLPTTYLIDQQGIIVRRYVGATTEQVAGLVADVENVLAGRPLTTQVIPEAPAVSIEDQRGDKVKPPERAP